MHDSVCACVRVMFSAYVCVCVRMCMCMYVYVYIYKGYPIKMYLLNSFYYSKYTLGRVKKFVRQIYVYIANILQQSDLKMSSFCLDNKLETTGD